jgi:transposase
MKPRKNSRKSPLDSGYPNTRFDDSSASSAIVRKANVIALEDLNVQGMVMNACLARSIADQGFGELRRQIEYGSGRKRRPEYFEILCGGERRN